VTATRPALRRTLAALVAGMTLLGVRDACAQSPFAPMTLRTIGTTPMGATVLLDPRTVIRRDQFVTATVLVHFLKPMPTEKGEMRSMKAIAHFDCRRRVMALSEDWTYADWEGKQLLAYERIPTRGFSRQYDPATKGSLASISLEYLCPRPAAARKG
jgi:hypothetical protein